MRQSKQKKMRFVLINKPRSSWFSDFFCGKLAETLGLCGFLTEKNLRFWVIFTGAEWLMNQKPRFTTTTRSPHALTGADLVSAI